MPEASTGLDPLPDPERRTWLLARLTELIGRVGWEHFACAPIVHPKPAYFPDRWSPDGGGVSRLLRRLFRYVHLEELDLRLELYAGRPPDPPDIGQDRQPQHHQGAAGLFMGIDQGVAYFGADRSLLDDPIGVTATLAHEVAHAFRTHLQLCVDDRDLEEELTDLTTAYLGFAILSANVALRHRSGLVDHATFTSQWSVRRIGYLSPQELCFLLAVQAHVRGPQRAPPGQIADDLETNQASYFRAAMTWLQRERPDVGGELGLPPRNEWPGPDDLAELCAALPERAEDEPAAAPPSAPVGAQPDNKGRPVFRLRRRPWSERMSLIPLIVVPLLLTAIVFMQSPSALLVILALTAAAIVATAWYVNPRCSDPACRAALADMAAVCPGCGGTIAGELQSADDRLAAEEALRLSNPTKGGSRTPLRRARKTRTR